MAEHTELPFRVNEDAPACIVGASSRAVAICRLSPTNQEDRANAAFIVTACNSHYANEAKIDALVKALTNFDKLLDFSDDEPSSVWHFEDTSVIREAFKAAIEALALASNDRCAAQPDTGGAS